MITSVNNEKVKYWSSLKEKKYRNIYQKFLIEGKNLVEEALKQKIVEELIVLGDTSDYDFKNTYFVNEKVMKKISDIESIPTVMAVCPYLKREGYDLERILLIDDIQDSGNLGTIIRSASAFSVSLIVLSKNTVDEYNPKVLRSTAGMFFSVPIIRCDLEEFLKPLKNKNFKIYGTSVTNATTLQNVDKKTPWIIIVGNEARGVSQNLLEFTHENIKISMNEKCESLNVGVATSIILYEFSK